jgi:hypothetical protein
VDAEELFGQRFASDEEHRRHDSGRDDRGVGRVAQRAADEDLGQRADEDVGDIVADQEHAEQEILSLHECPENLGARILPTIAQKLQTQAIERVDAGLEAREQCAQQHAHDQRAKDQEALE